MLNCLKESEEYIRENSLDERKIWNAMILTANKCEEHESDSEDYSDFSDSDLYPNYLPSENDILQEQPDAGFNYDDNGCLVILLFAFGFMS